MVTTALLGVVTLASAAAAQPPSPLGDWARGDGKVRVRIELCGQKLCAINTWIRPGVTDEKVATGSSWAFRRQAPPHSGARRGTRSEG